METIKSYIETNKDRFLEELFELIRIPSVSAREEIKVTCSGPLSILRILF